MAKAKPTPSEIGKEVSVEQSTCKVGDIESKSCTLVRLKAHYLDKWETPMAGAMFNLYINDNKVLTKAKLKGYKPNPKEAGTYVYEAEEAGTVLFEVTAEYQEALLQDLKQNLLADFKEPYESLHIAMKPYNKAWNEESHLVVMGDAIVTGGENAIDYVGDSFSELFTASFWSGVGDSISSVGETLKESGSELLEKIETDTVSFIKEVQAIELSSETIMRWNKQHIEFIMETTEDIKQSVIDLGEYTEDTIFLAQNSDRIFAVPQMMLDADVDGLESFISEVVAELNIYKDEVIVMKVNGEEFRTIKSIQRDGQWQTIIELLYDHEALGIILSYMNKFYEEVPPNFLAEKSATLGGIIFLEIIIGVILAILTAGAGTAARLGVIAARIANVARKEEKIGDSAKALAAFSHFLTTFVSSLEKLDKSATLLRKSRQGGMKKGITGKETKHTKKEEPKPKCSFGSNNKGNFTYDDEEIFNK